MIKLVSKIISLFEKWQQYRKISVYRKRKEKIKKIKEGIIGKGVLDEQLDSLKDLEDVINN